MASNSQSALPPKCWDWRHTPQMPSTSYTFVLTSLWCLTMTKKTEDSYWVSGNPNNRNELSWVQDFWRLDNSQHPSGTCETGSLCQIFLTSARRDMAVYWHMPVAVYQRTGLFPGSLNTHDKYLLYAYFKIKTSFQALLSTQGPILLITWLSLTILPGYGL